MKGGLMYYWDKYAYTILWLDGIENLEWGGGGGINQSSFSKQMAVALSPGLRRCMGAENAGCRGGECRMYRTKCIGLRNKLCDF